MSRSERAARRRDERGTSALEVAGIAPVLLVVTLVMLYLAFALYGISATQTAARQAARAQSLGEDPVGAADRALPEWLEPTVSVAADGRGASSPVRLAIEPHLEAFAAAAATGTSVVVDDDERGREFFPAFVGDELRAALLVEGGLKKDEGIRAAIGRVRYSTTGETALRNVQPLFADLSTGGFAVAHNGNISNAMRLRR